MTDTKFSFNLDPKSQQQAQNQNKNTIDVNNQVLNQFAFGGVNLLNPINFQDQNKIQEEPQKTEEQTLQQQQDNLLYQQNLKQSNIDSYKRREVQNELRQLQQQQESYNENLQVLEVNEWDKDKVIFNLKQLINTAKDQEQILKDEIKKYPMDQVSQINKKLTEMSVQIKDLNNQINSYQETHYQKTDELSALTNILENQIQITQELQDKVDTKQE
ncbi:hypothetical protein PPERSA_02794 [Pseudocohnilembus persalinus]|uniref:Uncharacterized protein n=1 Tax=Pseudocohnilembus persalinus TaxID=266149 RepID=A0A0V0QMN4_PSEPJ|nr:hypothetical protein PPERSA_02794 [Pseudocohnilembus persalinus]|eukprot:KRX03415.1 hypothetical protein PPERSA_02794 [Pseudocohnilembus persalinus]